MKVINLRTAAYFEALMISLGIGLLIGGLVLIEWSIVGATTLAAISIIIFSTHSRVAIDPVGKRYKEYVWFLGIALGEIKKFDSADCLFIRKVKLRQTIHSLTASSTIRKNVYEGYLRFSEREKILVAKRDDKEDLVDLLKPISSQLNVQIFDMSDGTPRLLSREL